MEREQAPALLPLGKIIELYVAACFSRARGFRYQPAQYRGVCALTGAVIKPFMSIGILDKGLVVREDAMKLVGVRSNDTTETILNRFRRWDEEVARQWIAETGHVLVFTSSRLKPTYCTKVEDFKKLRSSVCMLRRNAP